MTSSWELYHRVPILVQFHIYANISHDPLQLEEVGGWDEVGLAGIMAAIPCDPPLSPPTGGCPWLISITIHHDWSLVLD